MNAQETLSWSVIRFSLEIEIFYNIFNIVILTLHTVALNWSNVLENLKHYQS